MKAIPVEFVGPYSWLGDADLPSVLDSDAGEEPGIYLWTAGTPEGELAWYVGETGRPVRKRLREHLNYQRGGDYRILDPDLFLRGEKQYVWQPCWDDEPK